MTGILLMFFLLFMTAFRISWVSIETMRAIAAIATCLNLTRMISWMRIYEETSFFVLLIY